MSFMCDHDDDYARGRPTATALLILGSCLLNELLLFLPGSSIRHHDETECKFMMMMTAMPRRDDDDDDDSVLDLARLS